MTVMLFKEGGLQGKELKKALINPDVPKGYYTMFHEHNVFNKKHIMEYMSDSTIFIAIVREPLSRLQSAIRFKGSRRDIYRYGNTNKLKNHMAYRFGYKKEESDTFDMYLNYIDRTFHHVLIYEMMEESLVLMRHKLGWTMKDILTFNLRQQAYNHTLDIDVKLQESVKALHEYDYKLYAFFKKR